MQGHVDIARRHATTVLLKLWLIVYSPFVALRHR